MRKSKLVFKTEQQHSKLKLRSFIAILAAVLVLGGSVSALLFLKNYNFDLKSAFNARETTTNPDSEEPVTASPDKNRTDILLYCTTADKRSFAFICLMRIATPENSVCFYCLEPGERVSLGSASNSLEGYYYIGGVPRLIEAVTALTGIEPDRYAGSTEAKFKLIINTYGGVTVPVKTPVSYKGSDFRLILTKGTPLMKGDTLLKYIRWQLVEGGGGTAAQADLLREITDDFLIPEKVESFSSVFSDLANQLETDITIVDYASAADSLEAMAASGNVTYTFAESAEEFINAYN